MHARLGPSLVLPVALVLGCPPFPEFQHCEAGDTCGTTQPATTSGGTPTTSDGVYTSTSDIDSTTATPDDESGADTLDTTGQPVEPPLIISRVVMPDYTDVNALLDVSVTADHANDVHMQIDGGEPIALTPIGPGEFSGQITAFTALGNGQHTAMFTPSRDEIVGAPAEADYVIALPPPGYEIQWDVSNLDGTVAAIAVLPDGNPVELGTFQELGEPRCYLRLRDKSGASVEFLPVLPDAHCTAIDLTIDRDTGVMHVLLDRKSGDGLKWWAGEISTWGAGPKNIGLGAVGDTALALASRPGLVAVCGAKPVATSDERDALVVLLRDGQPAEERLFDYKPGDLKHRFGETVRDCAISADTLVLVGEANGRHGGDNDKYDRLMLLEVDTAGAAEPKWTVAGPEAGVQSRALAVDVDDQHRYHLAGYTCFDICEPVGEVRGYLPGGELFSNVSLGPLGSAWFGPNDIAWSPAGYAVVALGEKQGQSFVFKVQAFAPNVPVPKWTFLPNDKQGLQLALAVAVGPFGEVYAGGIGAENHPAFAVIGG